jgi:hypothetical protein
MTQEPLNSCHTFAADPKSKQAANPFPGEPPVFAEE